MSSPNILRIKNLKVTFETEAGSVTALDHVSLDVPRGQVTAVVGESGSGKSVLAHCILRLIQSPGRVDCGSIELYPAAGDPMDVLELSERDPRLYAVRGALVSMVFQEPMSALSPVHTVGDQVSEAIRCHTGASRAVAWREAVDMLERVGIQDAPRLANRYPFEFSGGMRQRVVIAMALVCRPELLICDEPTTALDVTVQAEVLTLIKDLHRELANSVIFITHDLAVVAQMADRVIVVQQGCILESGSVRQVLKTPAHPYTRNLLTAMPRLDNVAERLPVLQTGITAAQRLLPLVEMQDGHFARLPRSTLAAQGVA